MSTAKFFNHPCSKQSSSLVLNLSYTLVSLDSPKKKKRRRKPVPQPQSRLIGTGISQGDAWVSGFFKSSTKDPQYISWTGTFLLDLNFQLRLGLHLQSQTTEAVINDLGLQPHQVSLSKIKSENVLSLKNTGSEVFFSFCKSGQSCVLSNQILIA